MILFNYPHVYVWNDVLSQVDERFNMPELWDAIGKIHPFMLVDGVELQDFIRDSDDALKVWLPQIYLNDAIDISYTAETIRLRPGGMLFWSRHAIFTIQQSFLGNNWIELN